MTMFAGRCAMSSPRLLVAALLAGSAMTLLIDGVQGRVYERCELARDLLHKYGFPRAQVPTLVCIAYHESRYDTSAIGKPNSDKSRDYGIFQINNRYWCDRGSKGCGVPCRNMLLYMDQVVKCVKTIYAETKRLKGDGFLAWSTYKFCRNPGSFTKGCNL